MPTSFFYLYTALWGLVGLSFFSSKSGLHLFGVLLIAVSIYGLFRYEKVRSIPWLFWVGLSLYPLGILTSVLSFSGSEAVRLFVQGFPWLLLIIPGYQLVNFFGTNRKIVERAIFWGLIGGFLYGVIHSIVINKWDSLTFSELFSYRRGGPWDVARWGLFMAVGVLLTWFYYFQNRVRWVLGLMPVAIVFMLLSQTRTALVSLALAMLFFAFKSKQTLKASFVVGAILLVMILSIPATRQLSFSILGIYQESSNSKVVALSDSNQGRLNMWKVAMDALPGVLWFGTGFESSAGYLKSFLSEQDLQYREKYTSIEYSYHDQHSSYLNLLFQMGIIFSLVFWGFVSTVIVKYWSLHPPDKLKYELSALVIFFIVSFIPTGGVTSYDAVLFFIVVGMMMASVEQKQKVTHH